MAVSLPAVAAAADSSLEGEGVATTALLDPSWTCAAIAEALAAANLPVPDAEHLEELQRQIQLVQNMRRHGGGRGRGGEDGEGENDVAEEQERVPLTAAAEGMGDVVASDVIVAKCECACEHHVESHQVL